MAIPHEPDRTVRPGERTPPIAERRDRPTDRVSRRGAGSGPSTRYANAVLGVWLFASAFIWPHTDFSQTNSWVVGALVALFALLGVRKPEMRWGNTALSVWLFFSTIWVFHLVGATLWNNVIVAIVVFALSLVPTHGYSRTAGPGHPVRT